MKYLLIILFISLTQICISQNLEKSTIDRTLFIAFNIDKTSFQQRSCNDNENSMNRCRYEYKLLEENYKTLNNYTISFVYNEFVDFDDMEKDKPVIKFKVNKRFLKNNRKIILNIDNFHEMGYEKSLALLRNSKHIFLIDETETKNGQITIKEVFLSYVGSE